MPLWQTCRCLQHSWAILQMWRSQSNSPSPAQQHRPPCLGESKHSISAVSPLTRGDSKRPDGMTLIPWQGGKNVTWDVTVTDTIADSYLHLSAACAGSAAEGAASRKEIKCAALDHLYTFIPLAFETYEPINNKGTKFLQELFIRLSTISDDPASQLSSSFLLPCSASMPLLFLTLSPWPLRQSLRPNHSKRRFLSLVFNPRDLYNQGYKNDNNNNNIIIIINSSTNNSSNNYSSSININRSNNNNNGSNNNNDNNNNNNNTYFFTYSRCIYYLVAEHFDTYLSTL